MLEEETSKKLIVYFDGVCGLCNRFVDFLIEKDKRDIYRFAPLQSEFAKARLPEAYTGEELGTVVVEFKGKTFIKSRAVLVALSELYPSLKLLFKLALLVPSIISDGAYNFVASRRYLWFGRQEMCRLPAPSEKHKFIE